MRHEEGWEGRYLVEEGGTEWDGTGGDRTEHVR